jgi:hypothetical protein
LSATPLAYREDGRRASSNDPEEKQQQQAQDPLDECHILHSRASQVILTVDAEEVPVLCIEVVGNRFLRRMMRIIAVSIICYLEFSSNLILYNTVIQGTVIRESVLPRDVRNENILKLICSSQDRYIAAYYCILVKTY